MSRIEDVARLTQHRKAAEDEVNLTPGPHYPIHMNYQVELGMNDEWLLAVAGQFQAGDAAAIEWILHNYPRTVGDERCDVLRRMLAAARILEGEA